MSAVPRKKTSPKKTPSTKRKAQKPALASKPASTLETMAQPSKTGKASNKPVAQESAGFNLIGYATSPTGLGEDLRSFAAMLNYLEIPFSITDIPTDSSKTVTVQFENMSTQTYTNSMFFMSAMECAQLAQVHPNLFSEPKTKIGYFLWELPDFPDQYTSALKLVDHIWCPTKFVQSAFFAKSQQLILSLPLPVIQTQAAKSGARKELDIPQDAFVCLFMFDLRSTMGRKNPQAAVTAFLEFAKDKPDTYLILKLSRWQRSVNQLLSWLPKHPQIKLLTKTLSPDQLSALYAASNCYLSLHRSEGFGRTLVESLQHGLWLVSSNFSGPADYLNEKNAALVSWTPKTVLKGDYPFSSHSMWAEPSIAEAKIQLERLYAKPRKERNLAGIETGKQFTLQALAEKYRPILKSYLR
jgi:glycosyltransferase involved in cell wall biosynthesis